MAADKFMRTFSSLLLLMISCSVCFAGEGDVADSLLQFSLRDIDGESVELKPSEDQRITVICFLGAECPVARLYGSRLQQLAEEFKEKNVRFIGVGSNHQDSADDLREYAESTKIQFPIVKDFQNLVADQYGAKRTPEVFVLDNKVQIQYRGRIDNEFQPGVTRSDVSQKYLRQALTELLADRPVSLPSTEPVGCLIGRVKTTEVTTEITYASEVTRILRKHCVECHQAGEIGPFALTDYDEVVGWGEMMLEVIADGRMPPWNADPEFGHFSNARRMPDTDRGVLREWVQGGMPFGEADELPSPLPQADHTWQLARKPDVVLPMGKQEFHVAADEIVEYQYYVVDPGFDEDKWVVGAQVLPGNRAVLHHCIVFIRPPDGTDFSGIGWLTAYVPGQRTLDYPPGYARKIPAGSTLVFQMHYTPTGTPEADLTQLGLIFGQDEDITHELLTIAAINDQFEIPPRASNFAVRAHRGNLPKNGELLAVAPHMHVRGKSFDLFAERNGERSKLLSIPKYDFNWQHVYAFAEPLPLKDIDRLSFEAHFDNSKGNPANPDPSLYVTWGDQTFEEMAIGFFEVAVPRHSQPQKTVARSQPRNVSDETKASAEKYAREYIRKFDLNGDGVVVRDELPESIGRFGFRKLDENSDGKLTLEDISRNYEQRRQRR